MSRLLSRRRFLGGASAVVALPLLEAFAPRPARAAAATAPAKRLVVYYFPCGRDPDGWVARTTGSQFSLPSSLVGLEPLKQDVLLLSGLTDVPGQQSTSVGDHAKGTGPLLTGVPIADGRVLGGGTSLDQIVAAKVGGQSRFASLQWTSAQPAACDLGASCVYTQCISWADARTPLAPIADPLTAYDQLFGGTDTHQSAQVLAQVHQNQRSIIDFVLAEANSLRTGLSSTDKAKMEEYFTTLRALENSLFLPTSANCQPGTAPQGSPDYPTSVAAFGDMMAMALQCNLTSVITYMIEFDISYRAHPWVNATLGNHALTHTAGDDAHSALLRVERWQADQMAAFVGKLKQATDAEGRSLLDSTIVLATGAMGAGAYHDHGNVSPVLVGNANGRWSAGRSLAYGGGQSMRNMLLSIAQAMDVDLQTLGTDGRAGLPNLGE